MNNIKLSAVLKADKEYRDSLPKPSMWILDKIADEKLTGKFNVKKSNICKICFVAKSTNGSCNCY